jgi:hypothetical protein
MIVIIERKFKIKLIISLGFGDEIVCVIRKGDIREDDIKEVGV